MDDSDREALIKIDRLIALCGDRESALRAAADGIGDTEPGQSLRARAEQWAYLGEELQSVVCGFGSVPRNGGSVGGALHRTWICIKAAVNDADAITRESVRREAAAVRTLREASASDLPVGVRVLVEQFLRELDDGPGYRQELWRAGSARE